MRFVSKAFWSLVSSVVSVIVALFGLCFGYLFYIQAWQHFGLSSCGYRCLSDLETNVFRGMYFCLMLFVFAGTMAFSMWLAKRRGAWVLVTAICTVMLVALAVYPILLVTSVANCPLIENFPLPGNWCD
jgi:hypothetical protein